MCSYTKHYKCNLASSFYLSNPPRKYKFVGVDVRLCLICIPLKFGPWFIGTSKTCKQIYEAQASIKNQNLKALSQPRGHVMREILRSRSQFVFIHAGVYEIAGRTNCKLSLFYAFIIIVVISRLGESLVVFLSAACVL